MNDWKVSLDNKSLYGIKLIISSQAQSSKSQFNQVLSNNSSELR